MARQTAVATALRMCGLEDAAATRAPWLPEEHGYRLGLSGPEPEWASQARWCVGRAAWEQSL